MKAAAPTVLASAARLLLRMAAGQGLAAEKLARAAGLEEAALIGPEARIPDASYRRLWHQLDAQVDARFSIQSLADTVATESFGLPGYLAESSATVAEALRISVRFHGLLEDAGEAQFERAGELVRKPPRDHSPWPVREAEHILASYVVLARRWTGSELRPREVWFTHAAPTDAAVLERFFGCPLRFERPLNLVVFRPEDLGRPLERADAVLHHHLLSVAEARLSERPRAPALLEDLRTFVDERLGAGDLSIGAAAKQLRLSRRTLQRRLQAHGLEYQTLVDSRRRARAQALLGEGLPLTAVAEAIGFADASTLRRAMSRWAR